MCYGLAQAINAVERGGLDLMDTSWTEACPNNRRGYGSRGAAARPSHTGAAQDGVVLGSQGWPNRWVSKSTRFHMTNVGICDIVWKVSEVEPE